MGTDQKLFRTNGNQLIDEQFADICRALGNSLKTEVVYTTLKAGMADVYDVAGMRKEDRKLHWK